MTPSVYLKTGTGKILPDAQAGGSGDSLWLFLKNSTMIDAISLALSKDEVSVIEFYYGNLYNRYEGYTELKAIENSDDFLKIRLAGGRVITEGAEYERTLGGDGSAELSVGNGAEHPE
jgi:hypothetical protein